VIYIYLTRYKELKMKKIDSHIYYDINKTYIDELCNLNKIENMEFLISACPTETSEPNKSQIMYFIQSYLLSNSNFHFIAKYTSKLFYDRNYNLRIFWKLFTGFKNYKKVLCPKNMLVFDVIKNLNFIKLWLWINPNDQNSLNDFEQLYEKKKIVGIKLHMYWHNLNYQDIQKVINLNIHNKPLYIILNYNSIEQIEILIGQNPNTNFIFGYGGFPYYEIFWKKFNHFKNVYIDTASLHINKFHIRKIFRYFKINQIIFSTDYPYNFQKNGKFSYEIFEKRFEKIYLNLEEKNNFFYKNIRNLTDN
jgi:hypothetical protein